MTASHCLTGVKHGAGTCGLDMSLNSVLECGAAERASLKWHHWRQSCHGDLLSVFETGHKGVKNSSMKLHIWNDTRQLLGRLIDILICRTDALEHQKFSLQPWLQALCLIRLIICPSHSCEHLNANSLFWHKPSLQLNWLGFGGSRSLWLIKQIFRQELKISCTFLTKLYTNCADCRAFPCLRVEY